MAQYNFKTKFLIPILQLGISADTDINPIPSFILLSSSMLWAAVAEVVSLFMASYAS